MPARPKGSAGGNNRRMTLAKKTFLDFEQPIAELETKIEELRYVQNESAVDISEEIDQLSKKSISCCRVNRKVKIHRKAIHTPSKISCRYG
jgi:hypothetical protein